MSMYHWLSLLWPSLPHIHSEVSISIKLFENDSSMPWKAAFLVDRMTVVDDVREEEKIQAVKASLTTGL